MIPERWQQIEAIFQDALERAPTERDAFLLEACGGDDELRAEVESLLAHEVADTFLKAPIKGAARSLTRQADDARVGQRIGVYRVTSLIGHGGMGAVYQAVRDDDQYQKQVALKLVKRGMDTDFVLDRFRYERQILATLEHAHIARLLDGGSTADGLPYLVMEYIEGEAITSYGETHQLSITERLKLFLQVCAAVGYAHQKLIVHRDLKPSNIMVTKGGELKLLDFGIAKLLAPDLAPEAAPQTATELRLMTPDYASPEQVRGLPITTATDVYSLGAVLYELLTGERPHRLQNYSPSEIERAICQTETEKPSAAVSRTTNAPAKLRKQLSGDLDNIVLMAMRKEPERRYSTVEQFAEDIRRYLEGLPVVARQDTVGYRAGKFARRHKLGIAAVAFVMLSLAGGIVATQREARIAQAESARAEGERIKAESNLAEAKVQRTEADAQRAAADVQRGLAEEQRANAEAQTAEALRQRSATEVQRVAAEEQRARAERRFAQVRKLVNTFLFDFDVKIRDLTGGTEARELLVKTALEYLDSLAKEAEGDSSLQWELATAYERVADVQGNPFLPNLGQRPAALESYGKAVAIEEKLAAQTPGDEKIARLLTNSYYKLGNLQSRTTSQPLARQTLLKAEATAEHLNLSSTAEQENYSVAANVQILLGDMAISTGDIPERLHRYGKALEIVRRWAERHPGDRPQTFLGIAYNRLGETRRQMGDLTAALEVQQQALSVTEALTQKHPTEATLRRQLALSYSLVGSILGKSDDFNLGRNAEAVEYFRKSLVLREAAATADAKNSLARQDLIFGYRDLGLMLREIDPAASVQQFKKQLEFAAATSSTGRPSLPLETDSLVEMAESQARQGDTQAARQSLQRLQQLLQTAAPAEMERMGISIPSFDQRIGAVLLELGEAQEALTYYLRALPRLREDPVKRPSSLYALRNLADCYTALGQCHARLAAQSGLTMAQQIAAWREARTWYEQSLATWQEWPKRGTSSAFNTTRREQAARAIAQCDAALAKLGLAPKH